MDLGKCFNLALVPTGILIAIGIVQTALGLIRGIEIIGCLIGIPFLIITLVVLGWAGYNAVKVGGLDLPGAAVTGVIAGVISSLIAGIINLVAVMFITGPQIAAEGGEAAAVIGSIGPVVGVIALIFGVLIGAVLGAVCGAIGGFIANRKK